MNNLPRHIAIVMDGNGRWAKQRNLPRLAGHVAGSGVVKEIVIACGKKGIEALTLFAFSRENWGRPSDEVNSLMTLFFEMLESETEELHKNNVQLHIVGEYSSFLPGLLALIERAQQLTAKNTGLKLSIAVNYSGRWDIANAMRKLALEVEAKQLKAANITEAMIAQHLCLADLPEPDLFIRTSGEQRISNFLLWQLAYTELYFTDIFWPDFNAQVLEAALTFFVTRHRRYGLLDEQVVMPGSANETIEDLVREALADHMDA